MNVLLEQAVGLPERDVPRWALALSLAIGAVALAIIVHRVVWSNVPVDDAFITFRYSENLASGIGAVFNKGERVEGYSSLLWMLVMGGGSLLGLPLPLTAKVLGLCFGIGTLGLLAARPGDRTIRLWSVLLLALYLPAAYHFSNGLETALMTFLLTSLFCVPTAGATGRRITYLASALAALCRPEGVVAVALFCAAHWLTQRGVDRSYLVRLASSALAAAAIQTVIRYRYYGELIANSARAKLIPLKLALPHGLADLGHFVGYSHGSPILACAVLLATGLAFWQRLRSKEDAPVDDMMPLALFLAVFGVVLARGGGDSYSLWRFYVPVAPLWMLLAGRGIVLLARMAGAWRRPAEYVLYLVMAGTIAFSSLQWSRAQVAAIDYAGQWALHWTKLGRVLAETFPPDTRIALSPTGAIPYYSGLRVVDMLGLTNAEIARSPIDRSYFYPGHIRHDALAVLDRKPDLVMLANGPLLPTQRAPYPWDRVPDYEKDIRKEKRFLQDYTQMSIPVAADSYLHLFGRRDFLAGQEESKWSLR